jgi:hypothetical protein
MPQRFSPGVIGKVDWKRTVIALNLIGLGLGFGTLGILILVKGAHGGESWISGVLGVVVGSLFLLFAFYFCKNTWGGGSGSSATMRQWSTSWRPTGGGTPNDANGRCRLVSSLVHEVARRQ